MDVLFYFVKPFILGKCIKKFLFALESSCLALNIGLSYSLLNSNS